MSLRPFQSRQWPTEHWPGTRRRAPAEAWSGRGGGQADHHPEGTSLGGRAGVGPPGHSRALAARESKEPASVGAAAGLVSHPAPSPKKEDTRVSRPPHQGTGLEIAPAVVCPSGRTLSSGLPGHLKVLLRLIDSGPLPPAQGQRGCVGLSQPNPPGNATAHLLGIAQALHHRSPSPSAGGPSTPAPGKGMAVLWPPSWKGREVGIPVKNPNHQCACNVCSTGRRMFFCVQR